LIFTRDDICLSNKSCVKLQTTVNDGSRTSRDIQQTTHDHWEENDCQALLELS